MALRWLIQKSVVTSVIIGATSLKQLEDNMSASKGWALTEEDVSIMIYTCIFYNFIPDRYKKSRRHAYEIREYSKVYGLLMKIAV